jgi:hypothetical protein
VLTCPVISLSFGARGTATPHQLYGWSEGEDGFTWTIGLESALMLLSVPDHHGLFVEVELSPFVAKPTLSFQRIEVRVNGRSGGLSEVSHKGIFAWFIPPALRRESNLVITFTHQDARAPADVTASGDTRVLGFAFHGLRLHTLEEPYPQGTRRSCNLFSSRDPDQLRAEVAGITGRDAVSLALCFESLGDDCELGFFQRYCGAEPLGLLRFSSAWPSAIIKGLDTDFFGLGEPAAIEASIRNTEWMVSERNYDLLYHTFVFEGEADEDQIIAREVRKLSFLKRKFLEDLASGDKIFVCKSYRKRDISEVMPLYLAFRRKTSAVFLWLTYSDDIHPPGMVEERQVGFLCGYMSKFAPPENVPDIPFDGWFRTLANAILLTGRCVDRPPNALDAEAKSPASPMPAGIPPNASTGVEQAEPG